MNKYRLLFAGLAFSALTLGQSVAQTDTSNAGGPGSQPSIGTIGPANVWRMPDTFIREAHLACDTAPATKPGALPDFAACFIDQMPKLDAPPGAVGFARMYQQLSHGEVAIITDFKKVGPVDMVKVVYPLRANDNTGLLLVNGDPKILDINDMKYLDRKAMEDSWTFKVIKDRYPKADIWPTSLSPDMWPATAPSPDGGIGFIFGYPVIDGCHACQHVGVERFRWDFDAHGKFLHTTYIFSPPPPKHHERPGTAPPPGQNPLSAPPQSPPA
jgi:hypothetical protein